MWTFSRACIVHAPGYVVLAWESSGVSFGMCSCHFRPVLFRALDHCLDLSCKPAIFWFPKVTKQWSALPDVKHLRAMLAVSTSLCEKGQALWKQQWFSVSTANFFTFLHKKRNGSTRKEHTNLIMRNKNVQNARQVRETTKSQMQTASVTTETSTQRYSWPRSSCDLLLDFYWAGYGWQPDVTQLIINHS